MSREDARSMQLRYPLRLPANWVLSFRFSSSSGLIFFWILCISTRCCVSLLLVFVFVFCKLDDWVQSVHGHAVIGEQGVQESAENAPLWGPSVEDQRAGEVVSYLHHLGAALQEVQDPVAQGGVETQGLEIIDEFGVLWCLLWCLIPLTRQTRQI